MKVLVVGATGFTGKRVLKVLASKNIKFGVYARQTSDVTVAKELGAEVIIGDLENQNSLIQALKNYDGLISVASLGFSYSKNIVEAAKKSHLSRALFVSTTGIFTRLNPESKAIRLSNEDAIQSLSTAWTIVRPTMIFGGPDDRNISRLLKFIDRSPIIFVPGKGTSLMQPVFVEDLAAAIVDLYLSGKATKRAYNVSGPQAVSFNQIIEEAEKVLSKRRLKVHLPISLLMPFTQLSEKLFTRPIIKSEQILRLLEDKAFSSQEAIEDIGYSPHTLQNSLSETAKRSGLIS